MTVNGCFNLIFGRFVRELELETNYEYGYKTYEDFLLPWKWPAWIGSRIVTGVEAFSSKRIKGSRKAGVFHAGASEALSFFRILAIFTLIAIQPAGYAADACACFLACCEVLELCLLIPKGGVTGE